MSALFGNLTTEGLEDNQDRVGGFRVYDTDTYTGTIKYAYVGKSANSKARSVTIALALEGAGEYRETFWVTNKEDKNFYTKDGKNHELAGFTIVNDICMVTTEKPLSAQNSEEKVINIYDYEQKKEVPTAVPMLIELIGQKVTLGINKELRNKQERGNDNEYHDVADTREQNAVDKVFHYPSNLTMVEARRGVTNAQFYGVWVEANRGKTKDRRSIKDGSQNGTAGRPNVPPKAGESNGRSTPSLFGAK